MLAEVVALHRLVLGQSGGGSGLRDLGALESAIAQPRATFEGRELYADVIAKAAALGHSLISNHPFLDGNKRVGHASMETFLLLNGFELSASVDDSEALILGVAAGTISRDALKEWLDTHVKRA